jgi:hypothetical protein
MRQKWKTLCTIKSYIQSRLWRSKGLLEATTFLGSQPYVPAVLFPQERFLVPLSTKDWVDPRAIVWMEGLDQLENPMTSLGIKPVTFQLVFLNNFLTHRWTKTAWKTDIICMIEPRNTAQNGLYVISFETDIWRQSVVLNMFIFFRFN